MYSKLNIFVVFAILFLSGCSFFPGEIKIAEQLLENHPDSALKILRNVQYDKSMSSSDRAHYGILLFEALDKTSKSLEPDSVINFSIEYYKQKRNTERLATAYFYKGRLFYSAFQYENASKYYLLALENLKGSNNYNLFARIYSDLGDICSAQNEYKEARDKYKQAIKYFESIGKLKEAFFDRIDIGNMYRSENEFTKAHNIYIEVLQSSKDSVILGVALQEIGINFFWNNQFDSSLVYLKKSIHYPSRNYYQSIRFQRLSDTYFELKQYDSAFHYARESLKFPSNFYTQRECYRILANASYIAGDYKSMAGYMSKYQALSDSVRTIDIQTKSTVIESIYKSTEKASKTKRWLFISFGLLPIFILLGLLIYLRLRNRNQGTEVALEQKTEKLEEYEQKLQINHEQLKNNLLFKIEEARQKEIPKNRKLTINEKQNIEKKILEECLYLNDTTNFERLMNLTFNNIIVKLTDINPEIPQKEIICCCLFLLDFSSLEIILVLEIQLNSFYKLKQRISQKLYLKSSTDIVPFLKELVIKS